VKTIAVSILSVFLFLSVSMAATVDVETGSDGRGPYMVRNGTIEHVTEMRVKAMERRAATLDRLGRNEQASELRRSIAKWEAEGKILPVDREPRNLEDVPGAPVVEKSYPGSMICASPWGEDILIYQGVYAWDLWLYGNSFAVDYDSVGNLFAAVGLADSTIHLFYSDDQGATWTDEMTVVPSPPEPETRLDLCVSDDGDSTLLYLMYLYPGDGGNLFSTTIDYTTWAGLRWSVLDSLVTDSIVDYWTVRDHYYDNDYYLHTAYEKNDGGIYYTATFDHGDSWDVPALLASNMGKPCIEWGGYTGSGVVYLAALDDPSSPDASAAMITNSWDDGATWGAWQNLNVAWDNLDVVIGASHLDAPVQLAHAIVTTDFQNTGDVNIYPRYTTDGGVNWNIQTNISAEPAFNENLPDVDVYRSTDNVGFYCGYYMDDTTTGAFDSLMVVFTDTIHWLDNAPGVSVNDSLYMPNIRPQITYGGGPFVGVAYAGANATNIYYDNVWLTGVTEERRARLGSRLTLDLLQCSPNPFRTRTSISYVLPARTGVALEVYNSAGQMVRTLFDGEQSPGLHSVVWDGLDYSGREVPAGVYIYRLSTGSACLSRKLVIVR
jgi:hypothetical protein